MEMRDSCDSSKLFDAILYCSLPIKLSKGSVLSKSLRVSFHIYMKLRSEAYIYSVVQNMMDNIVSTPLFIFER